MNITFRFSPTRGRDFFHKKRNLFENRDKSIKFCYLHIGLYGYVTSELIGRAGATDGATRAIARGGEFLKGGEIR